MSMIKIDFHVHTFHSPDSSINPKDLIRKSLEFGVIPSISDHNSISSHSFFRENNFKFIPSEEIKTDVGDLTGMYLQEKIPKNTPFLEALDKIKEQGGISYLPHGFDKFRYDIGERYPNFAKKVQIVEVFNSRCIKQEYNLSAKSFAIANNKLQSAGSDSHILFEFGKTYVVLPEFDITNPKELLSSLKYGKIVGVPLSKSSRIFVSLCGKVEKIKRKIKKL